MKSMLLAFSLVSSLAMAGKTYQVTGSVTELTDSKIVVDKKGEKFEIERSAASKVTGDLQVGSKVTVKYSMTAAEIEAKAEKTDKKAAVKK